MLPSLPDFEYLSCNTVEEASSFLLAHNAEAQVFAGGTDLLVKMKHRKMTPRNLVNIKKTPNLDYISYDEDDALRIGAFSHGRKYHQLLRGDKKVPRSGRSRERIGNSPCPRFGNLGG
jgi:CO/xanthine dehydrogenase FAD-binding subunit